MDKTAIFIIIGVIILGFIFWFWQSGILSGPVKPEPIPEGVILFYGKDCPHCKNVEDFLIQNNIEEKIKITHLEVYYNLDNQNILAQVAQKCNIKTNQVGVPFLWDGKKCFIGDINIIDYLKNVAGIQ